MAHTKCGMYLLASSLVAALLDGLFEHPADYQGISQSMCQLVLSPALRNPSCLSSKSLGFHDVEGKHEGAEDDRHSLN
jgi:hypothetical protein